jgi:hypothetical protein
MVAKQRHWTEDDDARLRALKTERKRLAVIAKELGRTEASITSRLSMLNSQGDA